MRYVKCRAALAVGLAVIACLAWPGWATSETISSNVALFQTVTVESGTWTGDVAVMTDDVNGTRLSTADLLSGLWIDLGTEYNVESLYLGYKNATTTKGAKLRGYASQTGSPIGATFTVPNLAAPYTPSTPDWIGVRYIKISDEGTTPAAMTDTLRELRAFAQVETYANFIAGVTATASSTYASAPDVQAEAMCNNRGMTDQRGPVGAPDALSIPSAGFWQPTSGTTGWVNFDLGAARSDVDRMLIWNLNQTNQADRGIQHATIEYSVDGTNYTPLADANAAEAGTHTILKVTENTRNPYSLAIDLKGIEARHVRISALDSWGDTTNIGLSEVRFYAVPEPSVVVMVLLGLGSVAAARRR